MSTNKTQCAVEYNEELHRWTFQKYFVILYTTVPEFIFKERNYERNNGSNYSQA